MSDVGDIKGRVIIEYDGSGVDKAKKDLESLADIVGGDLAESTGGANEALSSLDEQMSRNAETASDFGSSVGSLEKPIGRSSDAVSSMTEVLGEQQTAIENVGTAFEQIQKPIEESTSLLEDASPPMLAINKNAQAMHTQLGVINENFAQMSDSLSQTVPLLPQVADSFHSISENLDTSALSDFHENFAVFQDALVNPEPYELIHQYLGETGQTWSDFTSSIGSDNAVVLDNYTAFRDAFTNPEPFQMIQQHLEDTGQSWHDFSTSIGENNASMLMSMGNAGDGAEEFTKQWNTMGESLASTEKGLGELGAAGEGLGELGGAAGEGFSIGGMLSGATGALWGVAGPMMAVQYIMSVISDAGKGIYNMAAIAEGPAAHGIGTFTGAVDVLGQHVQDTTSHMAESFGQGIKPMLDAMNDVASKTGDNGFLNDMISGIGGTLGAVGDLAQIVGGGVVGGLAKIITLNGAWGGDANQLGDSWVQSGWEGLQNLWANITGAPEPFPTPASSSQIMIDMPAIQQSIMQSTAVMNAQANNPAFLAAQAFLGSQQGYAQTGQVAYDISHTTGMTPFDYTSQAYQNSMLDMSKSVNDPSLNVGLNRVYFNSFPYENDPNTTVSCFPAGTPILLADGTEKAIETLQIGEQVKAHDGAKQVTTTVLALITPSPKRVYELLFDDGNTLTLTDSHPISTTEGWKSLSPEATKEENPGLAVSILQIGDCIHTVYGTCTLLTVEPRDVVQIYNITVGAPHTFYASGVLVHNKVTLAKQVQQNVADTEVPQMDMRNTNLIQSLASNFTSADLTHTFTANVDWQANGLNNTFTGVADWQGEGLANTFTGAASWIGQNLANLFEGKADWRAEGLFTLFTGNASWIAEGLQNTFTGVATWVGNGLSNTFKGVADWIGENLEHTFEGIATWVMSGSSSAPTIAATGMVPGFASGVEGFQGGLAVVGEHGPELVYLNSGSSVYPQSSVPNFLSSFGGGDNASNGGDIHIHFSIGSKEVAHEIIPQIAPVLRSYRGIRQ